MLKKIALTIFILLILAFIFFYTTSKHEQDQDVLLLYGNVDIRQVDIAFQVTGRVEKMFYEEGDRVQPDDLLGILDTRLYSDKTREAEANLEAIRSNLENADKILRRRQELIDDGSISQEDLDNAIASKNTLIANFKQADASLATAKTNLSYTEVYAPTEGTILTRIREPGTVVGIGDPIYTISITSPLWIRAFVAEPHLGQIYPGMTAEIFTDTKDGKVYQGHIGFISPIAEFTPKTVETTALRTDLVYRLRIYAENPDKGLRQGMPVTIKLSLKQP